MSSISLPPPRSLLQNRPRTCKYKSALTAQIVFMISSRRGIWERNGLQIQYVSVWNGVTILFLKTGIHKVLSIKPGVWVYDVLMLGEIGFVLLNTRWMCPGRTNHLFCCAHVPSSVPCQLCWLPDQSYLWGAGSPCNFILCTINANMLPATLSETLSRTKCFNQEKKWKRFWKCYCIIPSIAGGRGPVQSS